MRCVWKSMQLRKYNILQSPQGFHIRLICERIWDAALRKCQTNKKEKSYTIFFLNSMKTSEKLNTEWRWMQFSMHWKKQIIITSMATFHSTIDENARKKKQIEVFELNHRESSMKNQMEWESIEAKKWKKKKLLVVGVSCAWVCRPYRKLFLSSHSTFGIEWKQKYKFLLFISRPRIPVSSFLRSAFAE